MKCLGGAIGKSIPESTQPNLPTTHTLPPLPLQTILEEKPEDDTWQHKEKLFYHASKYNKERRYQLQETV